MPLARRPFATSSYYCPRRGVRHSEASSIAPRPSFRVSSAVSGISRSRAPACYSTSPRRTMRAFLVQIVASGLSAGHLPAASPGRALRSAWRYERLAFQRTTATAWCWCPPTSSSRAIHRLPQRVSHIYAALSTLRALRLRPARYLRRPSPPRATASCRLPSTRTNAMPSTVHRRPSRAPPRHLPLPAPTPHPPPRLCSALHLHGPSLQRPLRASSARKRRVPTKEVHVIDEARDMWAHDERGAGVGVLKGTAAQAHGHRTVTTAWRHGRHG